MSIDYEAVKDRLLRDGKCPKCLYAELEHQEKIENHGDGIVEVTNEAYCPACGWKDN